MTEQEWKEALVKIFIRSERDSTFRSLCLTNPAAAVLEATGIALPNGTKVVFYEKYADKTFSYKLPPVPATDATSDQEEDALIRWATECTDFPTWSPS